MGKHRINIWTVVLFVELARSVNSNPGQPVYRQLGGKLVLKLDSLPSSGSSITWKFESNKVVEYDPGFNENIDVYGDYKNRVTLDKITGQFEMKDLTKKDSGVYAVEVMSAEKATYSIQVISAITATPTITASPKSCDGKDVPCRLTCQSPGITDPEPLTYSWKVGDRPWNISSDNSWDIHAPDAHETFICKIKNPISEKDSDPFTLPKGVNVLLVVSLCVLSCLIILLAVLFILPQLKTKREALFNRLRRPKTDPAHTTSTLLTSLPTANTASSDTPGEDPANPASTLLPSPQPPANTAVDTPEGVNSNGN